jgi:flagellum-specific peptidoglycan hydrolase FlgJ
MNSKKIISIISVVIMLASCGVNKRKTYTPRKTPAQQEKQVRTIEPKIENATKSSSFREKKTFANPVEAYIYNFSGIAQEEMRLYGIPASIKIAQGILESGSGNGDLAQRSNNHFGIKCSDWQGDKVYHDDDELQECFRKYKDPMYSFRDHSLFLYERPRYAFLFDYKRDDYKSWAKGLRKAGYATDPKYPDKLISLIERFKLYEFDQEVLGGNPPPNFPKPLNQVDYEASVYVVQPGDTLYKIASKFNLSVDELKQYNQLKSNDISIGQQLNLKPSNK